MADTDIAAPPVGNDKAIVEKAKNLEGALTHSTAVGTGREGGAAAAGAFATDNARIAELGKSLVRDGQLPGYEDLGGKGETSGELSEILKAAQAKEPSEEDKANANKKLDEQLSSLTDPEKNKKLESLQHAVLGGDPKALADAIKDIPKEQRADYIKELNKNLDAVHAGARADIDEKGNIVVRGDGDQAVVISADGKTISVHKVGPDGELGGEMLGANANKVMKEISNSAIGNINSDSGLQWLRNVDPSDWISEQPMDLDPSIFGKLPLQHFPESHSGRKSPLRYENQEFFPATGLSGDREQKEFQSPKTQHDKKH
jgi:hypothetical protein